MRAPPCPTPGSSSWGCPSSGICYGVAAVSPRCSAEPSSAPSAASTASPICNMMKTRIFSTALTRPSQVWMSHGDAVSPCPRISRPSAAPRTAPTPPSPIPAASSTACSSTPKSSHTPQGARILHNFVHGVMRMPRGLDHGLLRRRSGGGHTPTGSGKGRVMLGLSGGVDSSVTAALCTSAHRRPAVCIFVNNGLLRKGEPGMVARIPRSLSCEPRLR